MIKKDKENLFRLLKYCLGISIIFLLVYKTGKKDILDVARTTRYYVHITTFVLTFLFTAITIICVRFLLSAFDHTVKISKLFYYSVITWIISLFTPSKIGEVSLVFFLKRLKVPSPITLGVLIVDKYISLLTAFILASSGFYTIGGEVKSLYILPFLGITLFLLPFAIKLDFPRKVMKYLFSGKYSGQFDQMLKNIEFLYTQKKTYLLINFLFTILKICVHAATFWIIFASYGMSLNFLKILTILGMTTIISLFPFTISGLGIKEATGVYLYSLIGVEKSVSIVVYLYFIVFNYSLAAILMFLLPYRIFDRIRDNQ